MNNIPQFTLIKQVSKICHESCGEKQWEKYAIQCATILNVGHFLAIGCTDFSDDISMVSLSIVMEYRFSVFILHFKKMSWNKTTCSLLGYYQ